MSAIEPEATSPPVPPPSRDRAAAFADTAADPAQVRRQVLLRLPLALVAMALLMFASAGRLDWWRAWAYLALMGSTMTATLLHLARTNPALLVERMRRKRDAKGWDKILVPLVAGVGPLAVWIVAGLDVRYGGSEPLPWLPTGAAFAAALAGQLFAARAMMANRFFSSHVRIQHDRGHTVVAAGPYALVRHPGYLGALVNSLAVPVALGTAWAWAPTLATCALVVVRTWLEDRTLQAELPGYRDYAARVRYRLVPWLW